MRKVLPIVLLSVALIGALAWGNYQGRERTRLAQQMENDYSQSFHNLSFTAENLTDSLAKLQASGSLDRQRQILSDLRVHTTHGVDSMAGLPLANAPLVHTSSFLSDLNQMADQYAYQVGQGKPLTVQQMAYLADLQKRSTQMESELHDLTGVVDGGRVLWRDLAAKQTAGTEGGGTPILSSLDGMDKGLAPKPDQGKPPGVQLDRPMADLGPQVPSGYVLDQVRRFMDTPLKEGPRITETQDVKNKDVTIPMHLVDAVKSTGTSVQVGVSVKGGHVIYVVDGRPVGNVTLGRQQAEARAVALLQRLGYGTVKEIAYDQPDGTALVTYVPMQGSVALMSDTLEVTVALDNGEITGFNGKQYWLNHHPRQMAPARLSDAQARERLAKGLKVLDANLSVTKNDQRQEVLAWCYRAQSAAGDQFRIFINAQTGAEEAVQRLADRLQAS